MGKYDDIIHLAHPDPQKHPRMPMRSRAAQFSPFAALTGYQEAVDEATRYVEKRVEPSEEQLEELDRKIQFLSKQIPDAPVVEVTYFIPDQTKDGGIYKTVEGILSKIDLYKKTLLLDGSQCISLFYVQNLECAAFLSEY